MTPDFGYAAGCNKSSTEEKNNKRKCEKKESDGMGNVI